MAVAFAAAVWPIEDRAVAAHVVVAAQATVVEKFSFADRQIRFDVSEQNLAVRRHSLRTVAVVIRLHFVRWH